MKINVLIAAISLVACNNSSNTSTQTFATSDTNAIMVNPDSAVVAGHPDSIHIDTATNIAASNDTIVPGKSIGKVEMGMIDTSLQILLGKPDFSDAAMGKAWLTWYGKKPDEHNNKTQLNVYTSYSDTGMRDKSVQQIRTTSSFFRTVQNIHVYSSLDDIKIAFPGIKKISQSADDAKKFMVYDDVNNGIAFEIINANGQQICRAIFVHVKGKGVRDIYIAAPSAK
jgi:hypothetical protein